jgi:hypothetical protein
MCIRDSLAGLLAGLLLAVYFRHRGPRQPRYSWEWEELEEIEALEAERQSPQPSESAETAQPGGNPPLPPSEDDAKVQVKYYYRKREDE